MTEKLMRILVYANLDKSEYDQIEDDIREANRRSLVIFSGIASAFLVAMFAASMVLPFLYKGRFVYLGVALTCLLILAISVGDRGKRVMRAVPLTIIFQIVLLIFGVLLGTYI